jgi:hypothetical protein
LEEKHRPILPCLGWFEPKTWNQKNCEVCAPFAHRAHQRAEKKAAYAADEEIRKRRRNYLPSTYRETDAKKYRTMQDRINAQQRAWRKENPKKSAALSKRYRQRHPQKAKESQAEYHKRLHEHAAAGKILAAIKSMTESKGRVALYLLQHRDAGNDAAREATGATESDKEMFRIRRACGVPGPKGRPRKNL